jgi:hypothetical protein
MSGHLNRGRIVVDTNGNWRIYTNSIPAGCTVLGTVTRDGIETGALVQTEAGIYSMLNARVYRGLEQRKVAAALGLEPPAVGRPPEMTGGKAVKVYLDTESIATAQQLGGGNVSEGIRKALDLFRRGYGHVRIAEALVGDGQQMAGKWRAAEDFVG